LPAYIRRYNFLKIRWPQGRAGSIPARGTNAFPRVRFFSVLWISRAPAGSVLFRHAGCMEATKKEVSGHPLHPNGRSGG
jgi:hypothetical protein